MIQSEIDFTVKDIRQNTPDNQAHFFLNKDQLSDQCAKVYGLLNSGLYLSSVTAGMYGIADLRSIVRLLINAGVEVHKRWIVDKDGKRTRFKEYYL